MHASSSTHSASSQSSGLQQLQKSTSPTPQQANKQTLVNAQNASDTPPKQEPLNSSGSRGTQVNIVA